MRAHEPLDGGQLGGAADERRERRRQVVPRAVVGYRVGALSRPDGRRIGRRGRRRLRWTKVQAGIVAQDGRLQGLELGARIESQVVTQQAPSPLAGLQCIGLASAAVQRKRPLRPAPLAIRMLGDQPLQIGRQQQMPAQRQLGVDEVLGGDSAQLLEAGRLGPHIDLPRKIPERRAAPQRQRRTQSIRRLAGLTGRQGGPTVAQLTLEAPRVEALRWHDEPVAGAFGQQHDARITPRPARLEPSAQAADLGVQRGGSRRRRMPPPHVVEQPIS